jgi:Cd(II)/Pb(II)-responsive transcriptional regulator
MRIGELAKRAGCGADTVRYYEREGLLPPPGRSEGNYRLYDAGHLARLVFVRNCRALEMSLGEIRLLLQVKDGGGADCSGVAALLDAHIGHVDERIARLSALREQLGLLRERCCGVTPVADCGILQGLAETGEGGGAESGRSCLGDAGSLCGRSE